MKDSMKKRDKRSHRVIRVLYADHLAWCQFLGQVQSVLTQIVNALPANSTTMKFASALVRLSARLHALMD